MGATVADAYMAFGQTLLLVAVLGLALSSKRLGISQRAMDRASALVTVVGLVTSAALLSVAFLAGRLSEQGALQPISGDLSTASRLTAQVLFTGGSGLLCMLVGATILSSARTRRWAGGCLAVSCLGILVLLPAPLVSILEAAAAVPVG